TNPVLDGTGEFAAEGQSGPVWFLAGSFGGPAVRGSPSAPVVIPAGKALFFPLMHFGDAVGAGEGTVAELQTLVAADVDRFVYLECTIDGVDLSNLFDYRAASPVFELTLPAGDVTGYGPIIFPESVADGYWIMLSPLPAGNHVIHFAGIKLGGPTGDFELDVT